MAEEAVQKQIGCMNGLLQLFDRHHFLSGRRFIANKPPPRLHPGQTSKQHEVQAKIASQRAPDKHLKNRDNHRSSTQSPTTSFSSSPRSSSFSSADTNSRTSSNQTSIHQPPNYDIAAHAIPNVLAPSPLSQNSLDLHDLVKDSIVRKPRGLAVKTATKGESECHTLKYIDSPRPLQSPKSAKARVSSQNWNEPSRVFTNPQEPSRILNEGKHGLLTRRPKDAARYSYDGHLSHASLKLKIKELPRLSLDSRQSSLNGSIKGSKNNMHRDMQIRRLRYMDTADQKQEPGSYRGLSAVIAELMGLEAFPDPPVENPNTHAEVKNEANPQSLGTDENRQRNASKELGPSSRKNTDAVRKPITSKCQNEPAPWKQQDVCRRQAPGLKCRETLIKVPSATITVYGEIEKRLAQLEFKKSGKDLRALKQILEAMQKKKQILEARNEDEVAQMTSPMRKDSSLDQSSKSAGRNLKMNATNSGKDMISNSRSPIVIVKPTKVLERASNSKPLTVATKSFSRLWQGDCATATTEKVEKQLDVELTPRLNHLRVHPSDKSINRTPRSYQTSKEPTTPVREKTRNNKSSEARTNRMQDKKLGPEKLSSCRTQRSDPGRQSKQQSRRHTDSNFPCRKSNNRSPRLHHNDNQRSDLGSNVRDLSQQGDNTSMQSDSNISSISIVEDEVTSTDRSCKTERLIFQQNLTKQNEARFIEDDLVPQHIKIAPEQPSPISVLDATFSGDESPSPVKKISHDFKDDARSPYEAEWSSTILDELPSCNHRSNRRSQQDLIVESAGHLIQKLRETDSHDQESMINESTSMSNHQNPDHEYIMEILLASGLLQDLESAYLTLHLCSSAQLINPDLFSTLEKMKASDDKDRGRKINEFQSVDKVRRKLVFDAVNEIIPSKLRRESYGNQRFPLNMPSDKQQRGQQLIRGLCSEVDHRQVSNSNCEEDDDYLSSILWQDMMHGSSEWTDAPSEIPGIVLDVERLIFKDLINEVVTSEAVNPPRQSGGYCRQLFSTRV